MSKVSLFLAVCCALVFASTYTYAESKQGPLEDTTEMLNTIKEIRKGFGDAPTYIHPDRFSMMASTQYRYGIDKMWSVYIPEEKSDRDVKKVTKVKKRNYARPENPLNPFKEVADFINGMIDGFHG